MNNINTIENLHHEMCWYFRNVMRDCPKECKTFDDYPEGKKVLDDINTFERIVEDYFGLTFDHDQLKFVEK